MPSDSGSLQDRIDRLETRLDRLEQVVDELRTAVETGSRVTRNPSAAGSAETDSSVAPPERDPSSSEESTRTDEASGNGEETSAPERPDTSPDDRLRAGRDSCRSEQSPSHRSSGRRGAQASLFSRALRSEEWLSYVGIALFLFGLAFLFKYSIEQGWLIPTVRVGFGILTGSVLLGAGFRIYDERGRLRQLLLGGAIATFYGTVFAAYQLYGLLSYPVAFGAMIAVTVSSIIIALQQDHAGMAVLGTIGGLGTPFLLYPDVTAVGGVAVYTCIVLGGACAVYLIRGWDSLLCAAAAGTWVVFLVPCADTALSGEPPAGAGTLQAGLVLAWLLLGATPVGRTLLGPRRPMRESSPHTAGASWARALLGWGSAYGLITTSPVVALFASRLLWTGSDLLWGGVAAGATLLYAAGFVALRRISLPRSASAHGLVAAVMGAYALSEAFGGVALLVAWAVEAGLLLALAHRLDESALRAAGHTLFVAVAGWLSRRFVTMNPSGPPLVAPGALGELAALGLARAASRRIEAPGVQALYSGLILAGWLSWWAHELAPLPHGQAYLSLVWGFTAVGLLLGAARLRDNRMRTAGLATLALFVGKLFLFDLATLTALWRIVLFLGAGAGFLLVGYYLARLPSSAGRRFDG